MVVHHAGGLHEGVGDGRADEVEPLAFQGPGHGLGLRGLAGDIGRGLRAGGGRRGEGPEEGREAFALFDPQEGLRPPDRAFDLATMANDAGIVQQAGNLGFGPGGDQRGVEAAHVARRVDRARAAGRRVWTAPYLFFNSWSTGISCAQPWVGAQGEFLGVPATGRSIVMPGMGIFRFEGTMAVENWAMYDIFAVYQQITAPAK